MLDEKTPRASSFGRGVSEEDDDVDDDHDENNITLRDESGANAEDPVPALGAPLSPTIILSPEDKPGHEELLPAPGATTVPASIRIDSSHLSPSGPPSPRSAASLQSSSPQPTVSSRNASPTPVSGDIILPLMIFAVVKANPPRLVSNLLYTQRFRRESASGGEEGYCLINLMAVAEFLENVDLAALGLGESEGTVLRYVKYYSVYPWLRHCALVIKLCIARCWLLIMLLCWTTCTLFLRSSISHDTTRRLTYIYARFCTQRLSAQSYSCRKISSIPG